MNRRFVGRLFRQRNGAIYFEYDPDWLAWEHTMPISMSLPLDKRRYSGDPVIAVFDNLLPDEPSVRTAIAQKFGSAGTDPYNLLATIGRDCIGAMQFLPEGIEQTPENTLDATAIDDEAIDKLLRNLFQTPLGLGQDQEEAFRISIAGAQEKTALLKIDGKWYRPHGTTPTTHIIKPTIGRLRNGLDLTDSVENEFYCLALLRAFGLPVNEAEITQFGTTSALVVKRFDRVWTKNNRLLRLPQEDMCQALSINSARKYESEGGPGIVGIMQFLNGSDNPIEDRRRFFMAQILFWLIGATDGHAKNFSILLRPDNQFELAPLYDVMTLQPAVDKKRIPYKNFKLAMSVGDSTNYRINYINADHFLRTGREAGLSQVQIQSVFNEIIESASNALFTVESVLPNSFPVYLHASVSSAVNRRLHRLVL